MEDSDLLRRAQEYASRHGLEMEESLGFGVHGSVFAGENQAKKGRVAIKVFKREDHYRQERDAYLRLQEHLVTRIRGCEVPELIGFDDDLWIIAMTVVTRPFVLDFADTILDGVPDFSEEVMADWYAQKRDLFEDRWGEVQAILRELQGYGIYMVDVHPGNISFDD